MTKSTNHTVDQHQAKIEKDWKEITGENGILKRLEQDLGKFSNGNATAGTRARRWAQELKKKSQDIRLAIQEVKNNK